MAATDRRWTGGQVDRWTGGRSPVPPLHLFRLRAPCIEKRADPIVTVLGGHMSGTDKRGRKIVALGRPSGSDPSGKSRDEFLIEEFTHMGDSLLASEEDGERRASFFLAAAGTVAAVLGASEARWFPHPESGAFKAGVAATVFVLGLFIVWRM